MSYLFAFVNNQVAKIILLVAVEGLFGFAFKFIHILEEDIPFVAYTRKVDQGITQWSNIKIDLLKVF